MSKLAAPHVDFEVRAGLVLYGGASLAIYEGGVAQEFLRAVRSNAQKSLPYGPLLDEIGARFVVDAIAGTSAGGINGVFLARALATGGDMQELGRLWRKQGDLALLLDWQGKEPDFLLNGDLFYQLLYDALGKVGAPGGTPLVDVLDLFVSATDFYGRYWRRTNLLGDEVMGRQHGKFFELKLRQKFRLGAESDLGYEHNDFVGANGTADTAVRTWLARLSRATAAFPGCFSPLGFDIHEVYGDKAADDYRSKVWMIDGGVLANHPFAPVIKSIFHRISDTPTERMLFYVEPDLHDLPIPVADGDSSGSHRDVQPGALKSALAAITIPYYQGIDQHLQEIEEHNRTVGHVQVATTALLQVLDAGSPGLDENGAARAAYLALRCQQVAAHLKQRMLEAYQIMRSKDVRTLPDTDSRIQQILQWPESDPRVSSYDRAQMSSFLCDYDLSFEERRIRFLIERYAALDQYQKEGGVGLTNEQVRELQVELARQRVRLWIPIERLRHDTWRWWQGDLEDQTGSVLQRYLCGESVSVADVADSLKAILTEWRQRHDMRHLLDELSRGITSQVQRLAITDTQIAALPKLLAALLQQVPSLTALWERERAEACDILLLPLATGSTLGERDRIEWVRISPYDATSILKERPGESVTAQKRQRYGKQKIHGIHMGNFAAFLDEEWRTNDYMWGRLDGADLIIDSLVAQARKSGRFHAAKMRHIEEVADACREQAFREILQEELSDAELEVLAGYGERRNLTPEERLTGQRAARTRVEAAFAAEPAVSTQTATTATVQGEARRNRLRWLINSANWQDIRTFLVRRVEATHDGIGSLPSGTLVQMAADALLNSKSVASFTLAQYLQTTGRSLPGSVDRLLTWAGRGVQMGASLAKRLFPKGTSGEQLLQWWRWAAALAGAAFLLWAWLSLNYLAPALLILLLIPATGVLGGLFLAKAPTWLRLTCGAATLAAALLPYFGLALYGRLLFLLLIGPAAGSLMAQGRTTGQPSANTTWLLGGLGLLLISDSHQMQALDLHIGAGALRLSLTQMAEVAGLLLVGYWLTALFASYAARATQKRGALRTTLTLLLPGLVTILLLLLYNRQVRSHLPPAERITVEHRTRVTPPDGATAGAHPPEGIALDGVGEQAQLVVTTMTGYLLRESAPRQWEQLAPDSQAKVSQARGVVAYTQEGKAGFLVAGKGGVWRFSQDGKSACQVGAVDGTANGIAFYDGTVYLSVETLGSGLYSFKLPSDCTVVEATPLAPEHFWWGANGLAIRTRPDTGEPTLLVAEMLSDRLLEVPLRNGGAPRVVAHLPIGEIADGVTPLEGDWAGLVAVSTNEGYIYLIDPADRTAPVKRRLRIPEADLAAANLVQQGDRLYFAGIGRFHLWVEPFAGDSVGGFTLPKPER